MAYRMKLASCDLLEADLQTGRYRDAGVPGQSAEKPEITTRERGTRST